MNTEDYWGLYFDRDGYRVQYSEPNGAGMASESMTKEQAESVLALIRWQQKLPPTPNLRFGVSLTLVKHPTMRLRWKRRPMNILQQCFCDNDGNEEWRDVEIVE